MLDTQDYTLYDEEFRENCVHNPNKVIYQHSFNLNELFYPDSDQSNNTDDSDSDDSDSEDF